MENDKIKIKHNRATKNDDLSGYTIKLNHYPSGDFLIGHLSDGSLKYDAAEYSFTLGSNGCLRAFSKTDFVTPEGETVLSFDPHEMKILGEDGKDITNDAESIREACLKALEILSYNNGRDL